RFVRVELLLAPSGHRRGRIAQALTAASPDSLQVVRIVRNTRSRRLVAAATALSSLSESDIRDQEQEHQPRQQTRKWTSHWNAPYAMLPGPPWLLNSRPSARTAFENTTTGAPALERNPDTVTSDPGLKKFIIEERVKPALSRLVGAFISADQCSM